MSYLGKRNYGAMRGGGRAYNMEAKYAAKRIQAVTRGFLSRLRTGSNRRSRGRAMSRAWRISRKSLLKKIAANGVHLFTKCYAEDLWVAQSNPNGKSIEFQLNLCTNFTELTTLFDMYRIVKAELILMPQLPAPVSQTADSYNNNMMYGFIVNDPDGLSVVSEQVLKEDARSTLMYFNGPKKWTCVPAVSSVVGVDNTNASGTQVSGAPVYSPWLDTQQSSVKHYGTYFALGNVYQGLQPPILSNYGVRIMVRLYIECKGPR